MFLMCVKVRVDSAGEQDGSASLSASRVRVKACGVGVVMVGRLTYHILLVVVVVSLRVCSVLFVISDGCCSSRY
jgi:hypothetical protein